MYIAESVYFLFLSLFLVLAPSSMRAVFSTVTGVVHLLIAMGYNCKTDYAVGEGRIRRLGLRLYHK